MKNCHYKIYCCIFVLFLIGFKVSAQNKGCDYITSQYYQKVAQAELCWLDEKDEESYQILSSLEKECFLLNGIFSTELYRFADFSLKYKNYDKAFESIRFLISNYGYKFNDFRYTYYLKNMEIIPNMDSLKKELLDLEKNFISDTALYREIKRMLRDDQYCREGGYRRIKDTIEKDTNKNLSSLRLSPYMSLVDSVDDVNYNKLLAIIDTKGFPLSASVKYYPSERQEVYIALFVMCVHFSDSAKVNHLKPILLHHIKEGNCPPELLACMIDRHNNPSIYEIWDNSPTRSEYEKIEIDEKRREIGMPSYDLSKQIKAKRQQKKE